MVMAGVTPSSSRTSLIKLLSCFVVSFMTSIYLVMGDFAPGSGGHHPPGREGRGGDGDDGSEDVSGGVLHGPSIPFPGGTLHRHGHFFSGHPG